MTRSKTNQGLVSIGALLWVSNAQYFIVQIITASAWSKASYSWAHNTISDLGNTRCGQYGNRLVCSPLHNAMNISFILVGVTIISGAFLLQKGLASSLITRVGFGCMACAGVGAILIGLFPENSVSSLHIAGAALSFGLGNVGMILLGTYLDRLPQWLRVYTVLSGAIGLAALLFFLSNSYLGLGIGGMERLVAYPQTVWMIILGVHLLLGRRSANPE